MAFHYKCVCGKYVHCFYVANINVWHAIIQGGKDASTREISAKVPGEPQIMMSFGLGWCGSSAPS